MAAMVMLPALSFRPQRESFASRMILAGSAWFWLNIARRCVVAQASKITKPGAALFPDAACQHEPGPAPVKSMACSQDNTV